MMNEFSHVIKVRKNAATLILLFSQDQKRVEKVSKRVNAIQEVKESVSLLNQLLEGYSKESCSQSNQELIKVSTAQHIKLAAVS